MTKAPVFFEKKHHLPTCISSPMTLWGTVHHLSRE